VLPQVLAGLGLVSLASAGCLLWLQRLQPIFAFIALAAIGWQTWLVLRPSARRSVRTLVIWWSSLAVTALIFTAWAVLSLRYR
jgi:hypothetical protein